MRKKQSISYQTMAISGIAVLAVVLALIFCISMVNSINRKMNESAASNLLNTTAVIEDTLESLIRKDLDSLYIVDAFRANGESLREEQIQAFCQTMGFDWMGIVDAQGNGIDCFEGTFYASDLPCYEQWKPGEAGYSDAYIGQSGRPQIVLWVPVYHDDKYLGTVFGGIILTKYYSANIFTFYGGEGRTYLFDGSDGAWILKSLGTDGTTTRKPDIYALLSASANDETEIGRFREAVEARRTGTAVFKFNGELSYLCFMPLNSSQDWYVVTVIAKDSLLRESAEVKRMMQWVFVIFCVTLVVASVVFAVWQIRRAKAKEAQYREALFANISANLDSAFFIYEKNTKKVAFVSENVKRLLNLEQDWIKKNPAYLFDWCKIAETEPHRVSFLEGTLVEAGVFEVYVENELGEKTRCIRLELIPADYEQELAVMTDITKDKDIQNSLKEAMQRAEAASHAKNDFLSAMSHDLRTPINGVVGMTAIAAAHLDDQNRVRDCLSKISESTGQLLILINEVLDMSQIESGKIELTDEPFNFAELLQNVLRMNYPGIHQKNHQINVHIHSMEHEEVIGDAARLTRVATNLISNAIKYTPSNGCIILSLREKTQMIQGYGCYELTVQDNGIGMSKEFQEKLFEPFEREEDVRISRIQGTGLGMSIVKNTVSLMMGSIQVESEKGKGSIFRVTVNLRLSQEEKDQQNQLAGLPVLVVDNDVVTCQTVAEILCDIGMHGEWTDNGENAVRMTVERHHRQEDYLAVLLDWKMPGMDGVETARRIREEVGAEMPIIILTAYDWGEIEEEARIAGVDEFLTKPLYKAKLYRKMSELTNGNEETRSIPSIVSAGAIPPGKRILLAEDNELNMEIAVELLRMMGIQADCADNGQEAVDRFAESKPGTYDMILMDIQMPKMNGYDATRAIRGMNRQDSATIPIVAMTANAFKRDERAAHEAGMDEHLTKPISVDRLVQVMAHYLSGVETDAESAKETENENKA